MYRNQKCGRRLFLAWYLLLYSLFFLSLYYHTHFRRRSNRFQGFSTWHAI